MSSEFEMIPCGHCRRLIKAEFNNGLVSSPEYTLIGDVLFHTECWNKLVDTANAQDEEGW